VGLLVNLNKIFPRLPIRRKLAIAFAVLVTVPLLVTGVLGTLVTLQYLKASAETRLSQELQAARERTEHLLATAQADMRYLATGVFPRAFEAGTGPATLDSAVVAFLRVKPYFVQLKLFYPDGELILLGRSTGVASGTAGADAGGAYYAYRAQTLRPDQELLLPAEITIPDEGGDTVALPIISVVLPLYDLRGEVLGVAVGELYASWLFNALEAGSREAGAVTGLVGPDGRFLFHSEYKANWSSLLAPEPDLNLFGEFSSEVADRVLAGEAGSLKAGGNQLVSFTPLQLQEPDGASLFLYRSLPGSVINKPARRFLTGVGTAGLFVLGAALVLAVVAATQFTRPIYQLREGARGVAAGDFDQNLSIETNDELEELAGDFARMAERLREYTQGLESLVEARSRELRDAHAELEEILANSEDAIIRMDTGGRVRVWNRGAEKMFGYTSGEAVGENVKDLIMPAGRESRRELAMILRELRRRGSLLDHHTRRVRKDGQPINVSLSQTVIHDVSGMALGCTLIIRDVTHHKTLEKQLLRSERLAAAGRLAAGIAHEINNPIGIVLTRLDCLNLDDIEASAESTLRDDLRVIRDQTERVGDVARRLLSLSRDEPDVREPLDLNELVGRVIHFLEPGLERKSLRVDWDLASELPLLQASYNELEMVILNLLLNAVDASPEGGEISVLTRAEEAGRTVKLEVSDAGPGIEEELLERIFEPFFTTKEGRRGTGLGLAVTRSVAQSHGGDVTVQSKRGAGSCFTVTLPFN
jgi:PAS domain S-box-containing protein